MEIQHNDAVSPTDIEAIKNQLSGVTEVWINYHQDFTTCRLHISAAKEFIFVVSVLNKIPGRPNPKEALEVAVRTAKLYNIESE